MTSLQKIRQQFSPSLPKLLHNIRQVGFSKGAPTSPPSEQEEIQKLFPSTFGQPVVTAHNSSQRGEKPLRVGVVFSGGQASGGHNVIAGLFDALKQLQQASVLIGFCGGPSGIISGKFQEISQEILAQYRNMGGFDLIGSGRTKIESNEQLKSALSTVRNLKLDGLVIIGGDDSNTNAAILAEFFLREGCQTRVVGVPKTIDGDLKNAYIATSFGFDTACKVYAEIIGNIARDAISAKKYTHFIKLMGRSASHIALECALKTHPNLTLIGEEIAQEKPTIAALTMRIADVIQARANAGKNYGIILIPEGLIEFIPEVGALIAELNHILGSSSIKEEGIVNQLTPHSQSCFQGLPERIRRQLLMERDPHGNVNVSSIETEQLFIETVAKELQEREAKGVFKGKFSPLAHFLGYEGRAGFPSNFDCHYCYTLGYTAALLIDEGLTGYMAYVQGMTQPPHEWTVGGIPVTMLLNMENRSGKRKPVIRKALVDTSSKAFKLFAQLREKWAFDDDYQFPGPIQFFGESFLTDGVPMTVFLEGALLEA